MKRNVMFARFPFGHRDEPDVTDWLVETVLKCKADPRIGEVFHFRVDDTPITMGRNLTLARAKEVGADLVCMIDNDMKPDAYLPSNPKALFPDPLARPWWDTAFNFLCEHHGPCVIAAPYCGPPPAEVVYLFRWCTWQSDHPNPDIRLEMFTREEAAGRAGIEEVAAICTGLVLIDMRGLEKMKPPYFHYEWSNEYELQKASTEDVTFSRDASVHGGAKLYTTWDCWAGHWKMKCVGKPRKINVDDVSPKYVEAAQRNEKRGEQLVICRNGVEPRKNAEAIKPPNGQVVQMQSQKW